MTFLPGPQSSIGTCAGAGRETSTTYTTDCEIASGRQRDGNQPPPLPFSIARVSSALTSVVQRASTREKKVNGRKRHLLVDVLGLILVAEVTPASVQDRDGAVPVLMQAARAYPTIEHVWVDGAYQGAVIDKVRAKTGLRIEVVKRCDDRKGFYVLPRRWVVERTNGWMGKFRILSKEYERTVESSRADILFAMVKLMVRRLTIPLAERLERR
jgi:putative transposase